MATVDQQTVLDATVLVSATTILDTVGSESLTVAFEADGSTTVISLEHGDDSGLSDAVAVPAQFLIGELTPAAAGAALVGYVGKKRYVRVTVTNPVAGTSIMALQGKNRRDGAYTDVDKTS